MRRILVENARRKQRLKRGGDRKRIDIDLDKADLAEDGASDDLVALDEALDRLAAEDASAAELVKLRYFAGMTGSEAAAALGVSLRTANRLWAYARAWLRDAVANSQ
jgi:RNA polymerase sigma factor (TIGR02999 family)